MGIEVLAMMMFLSLLTLCVLGFIPGFYSLVFAGEIDESTAGAELAIMSVPAGIALVIMYKLVPLHKLFRCMRILSAEKIRRANARAESAEEFV
jgi:hypothetical protein